MKIVIGCDSGIVTATAVSRKVNQLLKRNHLEAKIVQCPIAEIKNNLKGTNLVISAIADFKLKESVPVIVAFPYITGIGTKELDAKILEILKA